MASITHNASDDNEELQRRIFMDLPPPYEEGSKLVRGLQVPSCTGYVTSGFRLPQTLEETGITKAEWFAFTDDIMRHATLSSQQWAEAVWSGVGVFFVGTIFISWFAVIPASFVGHQMRKHREHRNMGRAIHCGSVDMCLDQWNKSTFMPRNLFATVALPGSPDYDIMEMDLSVSKLFRRKLKQGKISAAPGDAKDAGSRRESRKYNKASRKRRRAMKKCRLVIMPMGHIASRSHDGSHGVSAT